MMIIFFYWTINDDHNVPMITMFQGFTVLSANMKELTWYSIDEDNVPIMMIMTHLKWFTVLSANMKQLSEVSDEGNRVVDWFWEGVDLFPGCSRLLIIMFNRHFNDYLTSNSGSSRSWLCWVTAFLYFFRSWGIICNACVIHITLCMYYVFANHSLCSGHFGCHLLLRGFHETWWRWRHLWKCGQPRNFCIKTTLLLCNLISKSDKNMNKYVNSIHHPHPPKL